MIDLKQLDNDELIKVTDNLAKRERETTIELLFHLIEVETRALYRELGYSSMFDYATRRLKFSEPSAARRIRGARCLKEHPETEALLKEGKLSLCTLSLAFSSLNQSNKAELLPKLSGASKKEAEVILSSSKESKPVRDKI